MSGETDESSRSGMSGESSMSGESRESESSGSQKSDESGSPDSSDDATSGVYCGERRHIGLWLGREKWFHQPLAIKICQ